MSKAAPNWPAMVNRTASKDQLHKSRSIEKDLTITSAAASIWMRSRGMKDGFDKDFGQKKLVKFASKTQLARQCEHCQMLYTNFHQCAFDTSS
ncbi:hypothetical protein EON65_31360 [archaeon]|nr:MAG: hypothetical protein EON65_31360 [archaeon]